MTTDKQARLVANQARHHAGAIHAVAAAVFASGSPADRVLAAHFRQRQGRLGAHDRRLISETLFSLFRWWGWLQRLAPDPAALLAPDGATQPAWARLLFAAHALDNEHLHPVAAAWQAAGGVPAAAPRLGGLPLAVQAHAFGQAFGLAPPALADVVPAWLAPETGLPAPAFADLLGWFQRRPPLWLRLQTADRERLLTDLRQAGLDPRPAAGLPTAVHLGWPRVNLYELPAFRAGQFEVQDYGSQVIGAATGARPGERWWDACAGAGGKSLQLAAMMQRRGTVVASDIRAYKLDDLRRRARRAGFSNISPRPWDGKHLPAKPGTFDGVLVDAPCSCTGTWRRNPDARWTTTPDELPELAALQRDILDRVLPGLKPGGVLVYATCSICRREDEEVVAAFLATHPEFAPEPLPPPLDQAGTSGQLRIWPAAADSDATFVARFRRR